MAAPSHLLSSGLRTESPSMKDLHFIGDTFPPQTLEITLVPSKVTAGRPQGSKILTLNVSSGLEIETLQEQMKTV